MQIRNIRLQVTPQESKAVQEALFESTDVAWCTGPKVEHTNEPYLFIDEDGDLTYSHTPFVFHEDSDDHKLMTASELIELCEEIKLHDVSAKRLANTSEIERGDIVFMVCMGRIEKVVITSDPIKDNGALALSDKRTCTVIDENRFYGHKKHFFESDYGVGRLGITCNALFSTFEDAIEYTGDARYIEAVETHRQNTSDLLMSFRPQFFIPNPIKFM